MLRITIELVPHGIEALSKTIAEVCVNTDDTNKHTGAGYYIKTDNKIEEFAVEIENLDSNQGVLNLVGEILLAPKSEFEKVRLAELLLTKTRLMSAGEEGTNEE